MEIIKTKVISSLGGGESLPVLFSLTCSPIKGASPHLMTSDALKQLSDSAQSKCRGDISKSEETWNALFSAG